jgi:hypothetical protein
MDGRMPREGKKMEGFEISKTEEIAGTLVTFMRQQ